MGRVLAGSKPLESGAMGELMCEAELLGGAMCLETLGWTRLVLVSLFVLPLLLLA
jgi:hypothetical protein